MLPVLAFGEKSFYFPLGNFSDFLYDSLSEISTDCRNTMNWIKTFTFFTAVLRSVLLLSAIILFVNTGRAEPDELVVINEIITLDDPANEIKLKSITVGEGGKLKIEAGTLVHLSSGEFYIKEGGILEISSVLGTGIYSGDKWWDEEGEDEIEITRTTLYIDDGEIKILFHSGGDKLYADTIDVQLGVGGGKIDVDENVFFQSGGISGKKDDEGQAGDVTKLGEGTLQVGKVNIDGNFTVEKGTVIFSELKSDMHRIGGEFILKSGNVEFGSAARIEGNFTLESGNVEFGSAATIIKDFTVESGTVRFENTARIEGNFTLESGNVEFGGAATIVKDFTVESGTVRFENTAGIGGNFTLVAGTVNFNGTTNIPNSVYSNFFSGNFFVGERDEDGNLMEEGKERKVEFDGTACFAKDFVLEKGTVDFHRAARIDGTLDVREGGEVTLGIGVTVVGTLESASGTSIDGLRYIQEVDEEGELKVDAEGNPIMKPIKSHLTVAKGGTIKGNLTNIGRLSVGEVQNTAIVGSGKLTFESGLHTIESIWIDRDSALNLRDGVKIQLGSADAGNADFVLRDGTLIIGGNDVRIYRDGEDMFDTRVVWRGTIIVEADTTFETGEIKWGEWEGMNFTGAGVTVSGGGTFQATGNVDLGKGEISYFWVRNEKWMDGETVKEKDEDGNVKKDVSGRDIIETGETEMVFLEKVNAGWLFSDESTSVITHKEAIFGGITIAGNYRGGKDGDELTSDLTISQGGWIGIAGSVTDINTLTIEGGTLLLEVEFRPAGVPGIPKTFISANELTLKPGATIRAITDIYTGTYSALYEEVLWVDDGVSRQKLLDDLNTSQTALYRSTWLLNDENDVNNKYLDLRLSILSVEEYIHKEWRRGGGNIDSIGGLIEGLSKKRHAMGFQEYGFRERLESLSDAELQSTLRNALAGELAGNAFRIAMHQPASSVFRHLDTVASLRSPFTTRGQVREGFHVWFNPYGQAERAKSDAATFDGYNLSRYGFHLGGDIEIYNRIVFGTFFGYAAPNVKSELGKISANDYTAGLYFRMPTVWEVVVNMMIGFGSQDYSYRHAFSRADFNGSSLFASMELSRPVPILTGRLTPLVALDFQTVMMDSFVIRDPILGGILIEPEDLSSAIFRVGLLGEMWKLRTRLQYMRQIAGEDTVYSQTSMLSDLASTTQIRGTQWGKDWLNIGLGGELWKTRHWRISADYNFDLGKRTTSHLGSLNTVLTW